MPCFKLFKLSSILFNFCLFFSNWLKEKQAQMANCIAKYTLFSQMEVGKEGGGGVKLTLKLYCTFLEPPLPIIIAQFLRLTGVLVRLTEAPSLQTAFVTHLSNTGYP